MGHAPDPPSPTERAAIRRARAGLHAVGSGEDHCNPDPLNA
ncbi:MAG: hypothetical protein ACRDO0_02550 [Nocardioidaceae bacterium]